MDIEKLIEKFYEGVSTTEEELFLTEYFLHEEKVEERWKDEQKIFRLLYDSQITVPESVSERLEKSIMQLEISQKSYPLKRKLYYWISSAAAIALLCIGFYFITHKPSSQQFADTFSNPEEAALVAEQTLTFMSIHLNKGLNKVSVAEQEFDKANQLVNKYLNY